ncbi:hypothetical protein [Actinomadura formosensis]|uniref:hypothetical protein n=1 Tax=Actinomadura formosensis TaxID=60706 RepID=UPI003D8EF779
MSRVKIDRRVYLTEDRKRTVGEDSPEPKVLLCPEGGEVERDLADRYGLLDPPAAEEDAEVKAARRPPNKARRAAASASKDGAEDKSAEKPADKSGGKAADKSGGGS